MSRIICIALTFVLVVLSDLTAQDITRQAIIKGKRYTAHLQKLGFFLYDNRQDTILSVPQSYANFDFEDFNSDGYEDIYLDWGGNISNKFSLYLFIPSKGRFKEIKDFELFPDAKLIEGTKYYYSYHRAGCADNTWYSDLFYIANYTAIKIGMIYGEGCGIKDGIYISRIKQNKKTLIKTLPLDTIKKYKDYKWGFIKQYWTKNYRTFL